MRGKQLLLMAGIAVAVAVVYDQYKARKASA